MIKAIIFDFSDVLAIGKDTNTKLLEYIQQNLEGHYKLAIITNSSGRGIDIFLNQDQQNLFDEIIVALEIGIAKPNPKIYKLAAERLCVKPIECVYIDNHDFRVTGALKAGMTGIVYQTFEQAKAELEKILVTKSPNN